MSIAERKQFLLTFSVKVNQSKKVGGRRFKEDLHQALFVSPFQPEFYLLSEKKKSPISGEIAFGSQINIQFSFMYPPVRCRHQRAIVPTSATAAKVGDFPWSSFLGACS